SPVTIGRHPENVLVLTDSQSSRFHCVLERTPRGVMVKDLDSRNGTFINGKPIKSTPMGIGDVLTIGATQMRILPPTPRPPPCVIVKDLDSRNGTFTNGKPIKSTPMGIGDVLTTGATQMRILPPTPRPASGMATRLKPAAAPALLPAGSVTQSAAPPPTP